MNQREAFETLAEHVSDELVVTAIGTQTQLWHSVLHRPGNFYLSGPMGHALTFGLGLALARPKERIVAVEGDGGLLMNLGALAAVAEHQPKNLVVVIMEVYGLVEHIKEITRKVASPWCNAIASDLHH